MKRSIFGALRVFCVAFLLVAGARDVWAESSIPSAGKYDTRILRDEYGVPHIFGKTDADTAYGLGFAHCEDDWVNTQNAVLSGRGELAAAQGQEAVQSDYLFRLFRVREAVDAKYEKDLSPEVRAVVEAYADGITHFAALNPAKMPHIKLPVTGKDIVARTTFLSPFTYVLERDLAQFFDKVPGAPVSSKGLLSALPHPRGFYSGPASVLGREPEIIGSNTMAVGPSRSADGATRLAVNSHMPWASSVAYMEAHMHSDQGLNMIGCTMPGGPLIIMGHDPNKGWCHTINRPDLADMFALEANPDNPNQYRYDGEWRDLERATAQIKVARPGAEPETFERELLWSVQGPVVRRTDGLFALRFAGYGEVRQLEQWYRMNKARNLDEFKSAMGLVALPSLNTIYADKGGNVYYVYGGRIPVRAEGYDWKGAVPGNTSKTLWSEVYPLSGLPQILNPPSGFLQSCNSTPFQATVGEGNPDPAAFSKDMGIERQDTNRSRRARDLYGSDDSITREEFYAYKHDKKALPGADVTHFLEKKLFVCEIPDEPLLKEGITLLKGWDGSFDKDNRAAALAYLVGWPHGQRDGWFGTPPSPVNVLRQAATILTKTYGRLDPTWQEVLRLRRGKVDVPLDGGPDCLRAVYSELGPDGHLVGIAGDCYYQMVEWDKSGAMKSESISPYGAATSDENSPYYADQGPLFAKQQLRPTLMTEADVRQHLKREYRPGEAGDPWYSK